MGRFDVAWLQEAPTWDMPCCRRAFLTLQAAGDMQCDPRSQFAPADREALRRLIEERKVLLDSGVYSPDDVIIHELERRIAQVCCSTLSVCGC